MTRTAAVILNWNQADLARIAAMSVRSDVQEVILVDNGSEEAERTTLRRVAAASGFTFIDNGANLGYSGGNNEGLRAAMARGHDFVLVLNSDAAALPGAVQRLRQALAQRPTAAAVMPTVVSASTGRVLHTTCGMTWFGRSHWEEQGLDPREVNPDVKPTKYVSGEAFLARAAAFEDVGLFDERFFCYFEDAEWSMRALRRSWELLAVRDATFTHIVGGSGSSYAGAFYRARNHILFLRLGRRWPLLPAAGVGTLFLGRPLARAAMRNDHVTVRAILDGWCAGVRMALRVEP